MRFQTDRAIAFAALIVLLGIGGCQAGDSGGDATRSPGNPEVNSATEMASSVTVTYYYLPG